MTGSAGVGRSEEPDPFAPVIVRSAAAQVADRIVAAIRTGSLVTAQRLPAERELAQRLQVSRPTLREALAALELAGIVRSYQGSGTVVVATSARVANWGVEVLPTQVFEARFAIEPHLARLAARKRYPADLENLEAVGQELEAEFESTGAYASDLPVHRAIARAARNPTLEHALDDALRYTEDPHWVHLRASALWARDSREGHIDEVRRVIKHIKDGDEDGAAEVWLSHLSYYRDEMIAGTKRAVPQKED